MKVIHVIHGIYLCVWCFCPRAILPSSRKALTFSPCQLGVHLQYRLRVRFASRPPSLAMDCCREWSFFSFFLPLSPSIISHSRGNQRAFVLFFPTDLHCLSALYHLPGGHRPRWPEFAPRIRLQGTLFMFASQIAISFTPSFL